MIQSLSRLFETRLSQKKIGSFKELALEIYKAVKEGEYLKPISVNTYPPEFLCILTGKSFCQPWIPFFQ